MHIEIAALCDAATDQQGKLNLLGAFDAIYAPNFPVVHPHCCLAYRLRFQSFERGEYAFEVRFQDGLGELVAPPMEGMLQVHPSGLDSSAMNMVFGLNHLELPQPGAYQIVLLVAGTELARLPLYVRRTEAPALSEAMPVTTA